MSVVHTPVLLEAAVKGLNLSPNDKVIDGTLGAGGHTKEILARIAPQGMVLALDRDPEAIKIAKEQFKAVLNRLILINDSFSQLETYVERYQFNLVAGVLLDLGFSSTQLVDRTRGFSFQTSGLLDLRYNPRQGISAAELINTAPREQLEQILFAGGEPTYRRLTKAMVEARRQRPFLTSQDLLEVVMRVKGRGRRSLHPATIVWQALRIAVNRELEELRAGLGAAIKVLGPGGRLVVISFHSGEDKIVKNFFRQESKDCLCPPQHPVCSCRHRRTLKLVTKKVIVPSLQERARNPRSGSAKLRIAEKI